MKILFVGAVAVSLLFGGYLVFRGSSDTKQPQSVTVDSVSNVSIVDGKQIIVIRAKGGYTPRVSFAKAGIPTVLRFETQGTFDCSATVTVPSMQISKVLPASGVTDVEIGILQVGVLQGTCGMGMYPFQINVGSV